MWHMRLGELLLEDQLNIGSSLVGAFLLESSVTVAAWAACSGSWLVVGWASWRLMPVLPASSVTTPVGWGEVS